MLPKPLVLELDAAACTLGNPACLPTPSIFPLWYNPAQPQALIIPVWDYEALESLARLHPCAGTIMASSCASEAVKLRTWKGRANAAAKTSANTSLHPLATIPRPSGPYQSNDNDMLIISQG